MTIPSCTGPGAVLSAGSWSQRQLSPGRRCYSSRSCRRHTIPRNPYRLAGTRKKVEYGTPATAVYEGGRSETGLTGYTRRSTPREHPHRSTPGEHLHKSTPREPRREPRRSTPRGHLHRSAPREHSQRPTRRGNLQRPTHPYFRPTLLQSTSRSSLRQEDLSWFLRPLTVTYPVSSEIAMIQAKRPV